jgi:ferredoxin
VSIEGKEGTSTTYEIPADAVLYNALSDLGCELPHGCLAGSCGACRIHVVTGLEQLSAPGAIEKNTIEAIQLEYRASRGEEFVAGLNIRLSCRAKVHGDVTIVPLKEKNI